MGRFVVIGNPVAHSLSPAIHAQFARDSGIALVYTTLLAPLDGFAAAASAFFASGGRGANVTLPFKIDALAFAGEASERAGRAGAANVLDASSGRIRADNTDGAGLIADLESNLATRLRDKRVALLGAGGAARGVIAPILERGPARLVVANRTEARATQLAAEFAALGPVSGASLDSLAEGGFDIVINATSSSTLGAALDLPRGAFAPGALVYDMAYGAAAAPFLEKARASGARTSDGLGMLVEQAAEAFLLWHGVRPATAAVLAGLRRRG